MYILGISSFYHDSAAVMLKDGEIIYAIEEERLSRIKHDNAFPRKAIKDCLDKTGIKIEHVDWVTYYEKPLLKFERILENFVHTYPFSARSFIRGIPEWITEKIKIEKKIREIGFKGKILFVPHHVSHASAAFYPSPFKTSAILTIDGVGEYQTTGLWRGSENSIVPIKSINFPDSLGLLYSTFTAFLGFKINEDEYKLMGLAAYGQPRYVNEIYKTIQVKEDGSFSLDLKFFSFREGAQSWSGNLEKLLGKPRRSNHEITQVHKDIAASIQAVTEDIYFKILRYLAYIVPSENLCIGGGVALNALANGKIQKHTPFKNVYIFGASGDSGAALGSALFAYHDMLKNKNRNTCNNLFFGSSYSNEDIEGVLKNFRMTYRSISDEDLIKETAGLLLNNKIIGWFQGKMEFGPRALGGRSILANPKHYVIKEKVNVIKMREQFRPFGGSFLEEEICRYLEVPKNTSFFPFMNFCFRVKENQKKSLSAIVHKDGSVRIQTVSQEDGLYYKLIKRFYEVSKIPCILNTSFNLKGEPIVETPKQGIEDFLKTSLDYLVIGNFIVSK